MDRYQTNEAQAVDKGATGRLMGGIAPDCAIASESKEPSQSPWRQRQIVEQFTHHSPSPEQQSRLALIREAGKMLALTILANTPPGDEQGSAIMNVRVGVMIANAAVVGVDR